MIFQQKLWDQKKVVQCIYSDEKEEPTTKNTLLSKILIQI